MTKSTTLICVRIRRLVLVMGILGNGLGFPLEAAHAQGNPTEAAQKVATSQRLYDEAKELMAKGKYAEACPKLEESDRLDTGLGTRLILADCYEKLGKLANAWMTFTEAAEEAKRTRQADREKVARARATALESRVPLLILEVPTTIATLPEVEISDNGSVVNSLMWGKRMPVDPGAHVIVVSARGRQTFRKTQEVKPGTTETVRIEEPRPDAITETKPTETKNTRSRVGPILLGSVGIASLVVGGVFGGLAFQRRDEAAAFCKQSSSCELARGYEDPAYDSAWAAAHVSTGAFVGGGLAVSGAAIWMFWPQKNGQSRGQSRPMWVFPTVTPTATTIHLQGSF